MGFYYSDDPVRDFDRHDAEQTSWLNSLPKCEHCGEPIQDEDYIELEGGELLHDECVYDYCHKHFRKQNNYL